MKRAATLVLSLSAVLAGPDGRRPPSLKLAASVVALALAAGCIAAPDDVTPAAADFDSPLLESLRALAVPAEAIPAGTTLALRTEVGPEGGLAAFWWTVPEAAILVDEESEAREAHFLAAPVLLEADRAPLERWIAMAFIVKDGELALDQLAFGAPMTIETMSPTAGMADEIPRYLGPFVLRVGGELDPGDRIGFVVGGVSAEPGEMALVLQPLAAPWDSDKDELPEDVDAFVAGLGDAPTAALEPVGHGNLHQVALYIEGGSSFGGGRIVTGPVEVSGEPTNVLAAQRRAQTFSIAFESRGFGISVAAYHAQSSVGSFSALANAHGATSESAGDVLMVPGPALAGIPFVAAIGEGEDVGATTLTLDTTSAAFSETVVLMEIDLDNTLTDLLGLPPVQIEGMTSATGGGEVVRGPEGLALTFGDVDVVVPGIL